jgi:hypothetical protein
VIRALAPTAPQGRRDHHAEAVVLAEAAKEFDEPDLAPPKGDLERRAARSRDDCMA